MLCPEVWTFPSNHKSAVPKIGNYDGKSKQSVDKLIGSSPLNKMASIILPGCEKIPIALQQLIDDSDYYLIRNLKICDIVRKDFLEAFIKRGRLTGISSHIGINNVFENEFVITPDGKLIILVNKDLYQIIGLEGRPTDLSKERFEIIIDLKSKEIFEQPKFYERVKTALSKSEIEVFDFQLSWESIDTSICPSSIAKYFNDCGYKVEQHSIQSRSTTVNNLLMPTKFTNQCDSDVVLNMVEYLAFMMLECDKNLNHELNSYQPGCDIDFENEYAATRSLVLHCKGLLTADFITKLFEILRLDQTSKTAILAVNGYDNTISLGFKCYTIILTNDEKYFTIKFS